MEAIKKNLIKYQGHLFPILDALINGLNLMVHIFISWMITRNEYGVLNAVFSFITVMMVTGVSLQIYVAKNIADPKWREENFYSLKQYCQKVVFRILIVFLLTLPFIKSLLRVEYYMLLLVGMIYMANSILSIYRGVYQGQKKFLLLSRSFYIEAVVKLGSIVSLLYLFRDKTYAVVGVLLGMLIAIAVDYRTIQRIQPTKKIQRQIEHQFYSVFGANFFYYYLTSITLIMTNYFLPKDSGVFAVSIKYSQIYMHVGFSIITVLVPILSRYKYEFKEFRKWVNRFILLCISGGMMALLFYKFLFPQTIDWLFGSQYEAAQQLIFIQAISYFAFVIASYYVAMEIILDRRSYLKYLIVGSVLLTVSLMLLHQNLLQIVYVEMSIFIGLALVTTVDFYKKEASTMKTTKKLSLLFLSWRDIKAPKKGGAEVFTHEMLKRVDNEQLEIVHYSPMFKGAKEKEIIDGVTYIRKGNIATVILYSMLYYFKNRKKIDYVIDQCNEHRFFTPFWVSRKKRIFFIHQMGRELWKRNLKFPFAQLGYYTEDLMTKIYRNNLSFTVSPSTKQDLLDLGFREEWVRILPEGISFTPWEKEMFKMKEEEYTFTYVGRFARYKGIDAAITAFGKLKEQYPTAKMWIVGKENESFKEEVLMPIIRNYHLKLGEDITFYGFVSEEKKLELMSRSHSLLYPSDREGWGLTVTEAAAVGTPSIVYNSPGLIDAVNQGEAGIITNTNSDNGLLAAMVETIENKGFYTSIKESAYEFSKKFQWSATAETLESEMVLFKEEGLR